jgi:hypothetical protein
MSQKYPILTTENFRELLKTELASPYRLFTACYEFRMGAMTDNFFIYRGKELICSSKYPFNYAQHKFETTEKIKILHTEDFHRTFHEITIDLKNERVLDDQNNEIKSSEILFHPDPSSISYPPPGDNINSEYRYFKVKDASNFSGQTKNQILIYHKQNPLLLSSGKFNFYDAYFSRGCLLITYSTGSYTDQEKIELDLENRKAKFGDGTPLTWDQALKILHNCI